MGAVTFTGENQRLRGDEQSTRVHEEMEDLRQWLFEAEGRALGAEHEAEHWRAEVEQLEETLTMMRQEGEEAKAALTKQLAAKTTQSLVEQLTERSSERQLELAILRVKNELLQLRINEFVDWTGPTDQSVESLIHGPAHV